MQSHERHSKIAGFRLDELSRYCREFLRTAQPSPSTRTLQDVFHELLRGLRSNLGFDYLGVGLHDPASNVVDVILQVGDESACQDIHDLILARSSSGKLARLLLSWVNRDVSTSQDLRIHAPVTHEEMAQRIGASRETVTRLLSDLRKKDLIRLEGSTLVIKDRTALEAMAV